MLFWRTLQCQINIDAISGWYCIDIVNIIESIYFSNIKPILQKTIFAECWVWISSQYWDCILAQYLVNNFAIGSIIFQGTPQYQVNIDPITTWYCLDIGIIIGSIYFSNIKPILQKTIFAQCWVWISSQYWDCILAQYLVNKFCYLGADKVHIFYQVYCFVHLFLSLIHWHWNLGLWSPLSHYFPLLTQLKQKWHLHISIKS